MSDVAIEVEGLVKKFGKKTVVNGIDLNIKKGQVWGFLGPNGSGKTTTIRMICGLLTPTSGKGSCLGYDIIRESKFIKQETGYMTQHFSFWEDLTIKENLQFVARMYNLTKSDEKVVNALAEIGLQQRQDQLAGNLSGGWKQRLALAAVTLHQPKLLLLDEPTAGVDPQARREFWAHIHKLSQQGVTVLVSTHYMDEAQRCDQIVYLANGQLITTGTVAQVIQHSGLVSFRLTGHNIRQYSEELQKMKCIQGVAFYGGSLHIVGKDKSEIEANLASSRFNQVSVEAVVPELEEAFIALTQQAKSSGSEYQ
ncbi:ABC transporter ATP-binding protein [Glaciecola sp. 1036]|uniref:ABC transporter ATP-binding protein n=1 Tax=Alteromonadaceae TaxID=72275 RepID=UPI003CFCD6BA